MNILHVYKTYLTESHGGIEQAIKQITRGTTLRGYKNRIFCLSKHTDCRVIQHEEAEIFLYPLNFEIASTGFSFSAIAGFRKLAKWADVIHYHFPWPFADLLHFMSRTKKPTVLTYHSDIVRQKKLLKLYSPLKRAFLNSVSKIVATSPNYLSTSEILQHYHYKTTVVPIGLDKSTYAQPSESVLKHWKKTVPERFFLFIGVMRYYKGLYILLDALKDHDFPMVIVGVGPMEQELKERVKQLKLQNVYFVGALSDLDKIALLQLCAAIVFPSHLRSEAFGISLLEGAMFAKPLISAEIGTGTTYININQETGLVIPPSDPNALLTAMQFIWDNPQQAKEMGERAYQRYLSLFTAEKMVDSYLKLYTELTIG
jgi:glycosyltransferase involved in cell wall biosynthesis